MCIHLINSPTAKFISLDKVIMEENPNSVYEEATITIISKRKSVKKLKINAKAIIFPKESSGSGAWENEIPEIVPVKLSYRKSSQPIGHGKFGTVFSAQIIDIRQGSSVNIFCYVLQHEDTV